MSRPALLDTSYLIDLERETAAGNVGPARKFLSALRGRPLVVSIVTVEELLAGAVDEAAALASAAAIRHSRPAPRAGATVRAAPASCVATSWRERRVARGHCRIDRCRHRRSRPRGLRATGRALSTLSLDYLIGEKLVSFADAARKIIPRSPESFRDYGWLAVWDDLRNGWTSACALLSSDRIF